MSRERRDGLWCGVLATAIAGGFIFPLLGRSGVWDPHELQRADLARRVATAVFGAELSGDPRLPTLTDLGAGELATTSMALSFRLFGLHDWSGRLAMAVWAMSAVWAIHMLLSRLIAPKAGLYTVIALVTMPLFFVQARTMLGDIVPMAAATLAVAGLTGGVLDRGRLARGVWLGVGLLGLLAGLMSRGLLLGVAPAALAVSAGWGVSRSLRRTDRASDLVALALGALGLAALVAGAVVLHQELAARSYRQLLAAAFAAADHFPREPYGASPPVSRWLGVALLPDHPVEATFDRVIRQIGHAVFPWSALLPFALGRLMRAPADEADEPRAEAAVRLILLLSIGLTWVATTALVPFSGNLAYIGVPFLAAAIGVAVLDGERGAPPSRAAALVTLLLLGVLYRDFSSEPGKALSAFVAQGAEFPASFEERASSLIRLSAICFGVIVTLSLFEGDGATERGGIAGWARRRWATYLEIVTELATVWKGNLLFAFVVLEAALVGLAAMIFVGGRYGWEPVEKLPRSFAAIGINLWWAVPIVLATFVPALVLIRDFYRLAMVRSRVPRARGILLGGLASGSVLGFLYYPALAAQLSPKEVFSTYAALSAPSDKLALLGVNPRAAAYYEGDPTYVFPEARSAGQWLAEDAPTRRWLVVDAQNLPEVNAAFRRARQRNAPVLDGRSSQVLLLSNRLDGASSQSWLDEIVVDQPPSPDRPLQTRFDEQLEALGWEIRSEDGRLVSAVVPGETYRLRFYYRVLTEIRGQWKAFVHIDGQSKRYNADHAVLEGRYPMSLWLPGDIVVDEVELRLEPNFTPGDYHLFFGFFRGAARMDVTEGSETDDRAYGGVLRVL